MIRKDIFTDKFLWVPEGMDFNKEYKISPGDQIVIPKEFEWIGVVGKMDGITFINEGQCNGSHILFGKGATNCSILGNNGTKYGIRLSNPNEFGMKLEWSGLSEIAGVEIDKSYMGIHLGSMPGEQGTQKCKIHDNYVHDTILEAFYLGQDQLGGMWIDSEVFNNVVRNSGNDGIQTRNGYFNIHDNDIDGTGWNSLAKGTQDHAHGILFGGNTKNGIAVRNKLRNVGGFGIFANGYGDFQFDSNDIQCANSGVFTKNFEFPNEDLQKVGYQKFVVTNNTIQSGNQKRIEAYYRENGCKVTFTTANNTGVGNDLYMPGIAVNSIEPPKPKEVYEKFYRVVSGHRKYYTLYKDGSYELKK